MWALAAVAVLAAAPEFEVRTLDGRAFTGELTHWSAESVTVQTAEGDRTAPIAQLALVRAKAPPQATSAVPHAWVALVDGSTMPAVSFRVAKKIATLTLPGGEEMQAPILALDTVRLREQDEAAAAQWTAIVEGDRAGDLLVLRKKNALDYVAGELSDLGEQAVEFKVDGESRSVKLTRVEGLVYLRRAPEQLPEAKFSVSEASGARWQVASAELVDSVLQIRTPAGIERSLPLTQIASLEFRVQYLSDLKPDTSTTAPYLADPSVADQLAPLYAPQFDINWRGGPIVLAGVSYAKGLALHSQSELSYRLPAGKFSRLQAMVGIDDSVRPNGACVLKIMGDDKSLAELTIHGADSPQPLDVAVAGVRRLKIVVEYGDDLDISDCLDLADAKLLP